MTFEYVLLAGVNDRPEDVDALAKLLGGKQVFVNLIPYNEVAGAVRITGPTPRKVAGFRRSLRGARDQRGDPREPGRGGKRRLRTAAPRSAEGRARVTEGKPLVLRRPRHPAHDALRRGRRQRI